ncbi:hypothetical protein SEA_CHASER_66 [Mycobacterium phage Chaser]|nr:hypothetical protein SEA_CHASER_66 [Mycobacterium phage Chaser]
MSGIAYPRRNDAVRYERFDGTLESAQIISNMSGVSVKAELQPNLSIREGDTVRLKEVSVGGNTVNIGDCCVVGRSGNALFYPADVFHDKFSKDGN